MTAPEPTFSHQRSATPPPRRPVMPRTVPPTGREWAAIRRRNRAQTALTRISARIRGET